jgi:hypothetical protein
LLFQKLDRTYKFNQLAEIIGHSANERVNALGGHFGEVSRPRNQRERAVTVKE